MKKSCKHIDITDPDEIVFFVYDCLMRHKKRRAMRTMLKKAVQMTGEENNALLENNYPVVGAIAYRLAEYIADAIRTHNVPKFVPVIKKREDKTSGKERLIGREPALQQFFDYVAVYGCAELWQRKLVIQQCSSLKNRGQTYGMNLIKHYVDKDNRQVRYAKSHNLRYTRQCKYFVKLDIKKCYPSVDKKVLLERLEHDIGNENILYLWQCLLDSYGRAITPDGKPYTGLMIGALPSQFAAQLLISNIYRFIMESGQAAHCVIFMDDILIIGPNRRELKKLVGSVTTYAKDELHLTIKPNWHIRKIDDFSIDMMGYVVHSNGKVSMRTRNFLHARRLFLRAGRGKFGIRSAQRLVSYKGFFDHSCSSKAKDKYGAIEKFQQAQNLLSRTEKERKEKHGD